jgi:hypothetical protein
MQLLTLRNIAIIAAVSLVIHVIAAPLYRAVDQVEGN